MAAWLTFSTSVAVMDNHNNHSSPRILQLSFYKVISQTHNTVPQVGIIVIYDCMYIEVAEWCFSNFTTSINLVSKTSQFLPRMLMEPQRLQVLDSVWNFNLESTIPYMHLAYTFADTEMLKSWRRSVVCITAIIQIDGTMHGLVYCVSPYLAICNLTATTKHTSYS